MLTTLALAVLALLLAFLASLVIVIPTPRQYYYLSLIPGPKGYFLLGNSLELATVKTEDILNYFVSKITEFGRLTKLWVMGAGLLLIRDPEDVQVLLSSMNHITKGWEYLSILPWLREGLLTSTGRKWQTRRKMLTSSFHFRILEGSMSSFNKHCKLLVEAIDRTGARAVNVHDFTTTCTLDTITESAMGIDLGTQNEASKDYLTKVQRISKLAVLRMVSPLLYRDFYFAISSAGREFFKLMNYLQGFTTKVIKEREQKFISERTYEDSNQNKSKVRLAFLDTLLEIEAKQPGSLSSEDIREEVDTFMFEGHDTTSQALTFFFFNMGTYPEIQEKVYQELEEIFGDDWDREMTMKDIQSMHYLERAMKENLRLYPSVPYFSRRLEQDLQLESALIPAKTNVSVMPYVIHRNEKHWPEPEKFDPDRFLEDVSAARHPFAYIPFSAGPRNCIGQKFAMLELKSIAASVLRRFRITTETKREDFKLTIHLILRSTSPIICRFHPRH